MDFEFKSIKALFKGKINPKSTNKRYRHNNVINLPLCYTIDNKNIRNYSFTKKMLKKNLYETKIYQYAQITAYQVRMPPLITKKY